ncbi:hypothetical protein F5X96DRAFT_631956 [Biscogniauxia mediterranea]|nr:hypothetical protein F5X96DRAFT_631956 [Biscogniauxia mediterranea]
MADSVVTRVPGDEHSFSPFSKIGTKDKSVGYYERTFSGCPSDARELLENYAGVPADDVDAHILTIRDKAWDIYPYPCIGQFSFLNLTLRHHPSYASMVARLKSGEARYLDIGFCLGQDIRKLVADGVPSQSIYGAELHGPFIDLGYDLWRDRDTLQAHLMQADALTLEGGGGLGDLQGTVDYIHLGMVLHVFDRPKQALLLENCVRLLKPDQPGTTMILGVAVGDVEGLQTPAGFFMNSDATLRQLCAEVSERMGRRLDCRVNMLGTGMGKWETDRSRRLAFEIEML